MFTTILLAENNVNDVSALQFGIYIGCTLVLLMLLNSGMDFLGKIKTAFIGKDEEKKETRLDRLESGMQQVNLQLATIVASLPNMRELSKQVEEHSVAIARIEARGCSYRSECLNMVNPSKPEK